MVAVFDNDGKVVEEQRFETNQNYEDFLTDLRKTVNKLTTKDFQKAVVAIPGRINREEGWVLGYGTLKWGKEPVEADVEKILNCPVRIENDAKVAGLYEASVVDKYDQVLYVTVGTGISCALITKGKINTGLADSEGGQVLVDFRGQMKTWEDVISGRAIVKRFGKLATDITDAHIWKTIAHDLGLGMIDLISVIQPDVIVMGGGVNTNFDKYIDYLREELKQYETPLVPIPPIKQAKYPEEAVIYGCYKLSQEKHGRARK